MSTFTLRLQDARRAEEFSAVRSFVGEDATGSFGILAGHARMATVLVVGLARFRTEAEPWRYVATPGALVYFRDNALMLSTRRYICDPDYTRISAALREELLVEEERLHATKESLRRMEEALLKRMWEFGRGAA